MRSIWTGSISFGLVNIGVRLYSATQDHDLTLHQVHDADGGRIRYQRRCDVCGREVAYEHIDRAYAEQDRTVVITDDELRELPTEQSREISVQEFVPRDQIDPMMLSRSYFLAPEKRAIKAYYLLRRTLDDTDRTAVVNFTLRNKTRLGVLRTRGKVLVLQGLLWDDEVREPDFSELDQNPRLSKAERESAAGLVDSLSADFSPGRFSDEYQDELKQLVEAKLTEGESLDTAATFGEESESGGDEEDEEKIVDLTEALRRSVERAGDRRQSGGAKKSSRARSSSSSDGRSSNKKSPNKSSPSTKSQSKKAQSKKAPSKKSPGKKSTTGQRAPNKRAS